MARVAKSALVSHSASEMFQLVYDVESYPEFLPWCQTTRVLSTTEANTICAEIVVARLGIRQAFATCNTFEKDAWMTIRLKKGPFKHLEGRWTFMALRPDACKVSLDLDFAFSGLLIDRAFGPVFHQIANTMVDAFCRRADEVYGG